MNDSTHSGSSAGRAGTCADAGNGSQADSAAIAIEKITAAIAGFRIRWSNESELHRALEILFDSIGLTIIHEFRIDDANRIDFYLPAEKLGIEVKIDGSPSAVLGQVHRYCQSDLIAAIVVITAKLHLNLPPTMNAKPVKMIGLWRNCF